MPARARQAHESVDVRELLQETFTLLRHSPEIATDTSIWKKIIRTKRRWSNADASQLKQVFWNHRAQRLAGDARRRNVARRAADDSPGIVCESPLQTPGAGMSPEQVEHLFEPFSSTNRRHGARPFDRLSNHPRSRWYNQRPQPRRTGNDDHHRVAGGQESRSPEARSQNEEANRSYAIAAEFDVVEMDRVPAKSFQDLIVWQKAHQFVLAVYNYSDYFPAERDLWFDLAIQTGGDFIPANIAEGFKKRGADDKARFLNIAQGSLEECRYYLVLAKDLGYGDNPELLPQLEEVSKLLEKYIASILDSGS